MMGLFSTQPVLYARALIFMAGFALNTIVYSFPVVLTGVLPLRWRYRFVKSYAWISLRWLRICCGLRYRFEGLENLPAEPAIVFSKHQSTLETLVLTLHMPPAAYVAKRELLWVPFFGWGMAALNYIMIDRASGRKAVEQIVAQAKDRLARGMWIIIFPEGTRRAVGSPPNYKIGGAVMAVETGAPVVPIAMNSGDFWPRHSLIKWPGEVVFSIGPSIDTRDQSAEQARAAAKQWIEAKMAEISR